mgnify:CR=1 FL=1
MVRIMIPLAIALALLIPASAHAQGAGCQYVLGFKALHDLDPADIGDCVDNQAFAWNGDAQQHTTRGLLAWRRLDNWTAFTNGYQTWINGPHGLVRRLNTQRFAWELPDIDLSRIVLDIKDLPGWTEDLSGPNNNSGRDVAAYAHFTDPRIAPKGVWCDAGWRVTGDEDNSPDAQANRQMQAAPGQWNRIDSPLVGDSTAELVTSDGVVWLYFSRGPVVMRLQSFDDPALTIPLARIMESRAEGQLATARANAIPG